MSRWNGLSNMRFAAHHNCVALDASTDGWEGGTPGIGGYNFIKNDWFKSSVPAHMQLWPICDLELLAHIICVRMWGGEWAGTEIYGLTDSEPCEYFLRHGRSRIPRRLQMYRHLMALQHRHDFLWVPGPVRSAANVLPDCASRWRDPERRATFWSTCAEMGVVPVERQVLADHFNIPDL